MKNKTILIIDDDETILSIVEATLEKNGYSVLTASDGIDGLKIVNTMPPDAIILDRNMPDMSGDEVLDQLKSDESTKNIPVMMLTAKNDIKDISESLEKGARDYIVKPFDHDNLIIRLKNLFR